MAGLEAARLGQIRLGDVVGLPLFNIGRRWRACCRGSWAIDDELGELRGIVGALAVVLHWPILDDFTSFSSAIRPSAWAISGVSNESIDVWTGLPFPVMTQR